MREFARRGLQDFSISRLATKMPWGIPVPDDESQVMYVWFDALTNYISTLADEGVDTLDQLVASQKFQDFWVHGTPTQYCGKDNTRFQGIMWQAMLMAAQIPATRQVVVNGFITGDGGIRMSKTLGNVVDPRDIVTEFGTDALRYFLLREVSSFEDSPFTRERFLASYNAGLANGIGNLTSRIITMASAHLESAVVLDDDFYPKIDITKEMESFDISGAMKIISTYLNTLDVTIQESQPFKLVKVDREKGIEEITKLVKRLYYVAKQLSPFLPETSKEIIALIKENKKPDSPLFMRKE